jgi:hypothetical protein
LPSGSIPYRWPRGGKLARESATNVWIGVA